MNHSAEPQDVLEKNSIVIGVMNGSLFSYRVLDRYTKVSEIMSFIKYVGGDYPPGKI